MIDLRENPILEMDGSKVNFIFDYESSVCNNLLTGESTVIDLPKSNVLIYQTQDGTRIAARPSGTEPKIKFYFSTNAPLSNIDLFSTVESQLEEKIKRIINEMAL